MSATHVYASRKRRKPIPKSSHPPPESVKSNPSKRHRDRLNGELDRLGSQLPFPQEVISKLDKLTILRLSVSYLRAKSHFNVSLNSKRSSHIANNSKVQELLEGELLLQVINGFVLVVTSNGTIFYTSSTVEDYLGFHQSDLIQQSVYELVHTDDRAEFQKQLHWALKPSCIPDSGQLVQASQDAPLPQMYSSPEQLPPENSTFLERNFVCRLRCLLDNSSGFLAVNFQGRLKFLYGQNERTVDGKPIPPQLALFALVCPVQPPSILEIRTKSFMFRTKHKLDFTPTACDAKGKTVLGYTEAELCYRGSGYQFIHAADMLYCAENHMRMIKTGESGLTVFRLLTKNNHWVWVQANARLVYKNGQPDCIIASQRAITDEEGEENLRKRTMTLPFSFTTGEAVLYETNLPRSLKNTTPSDPSAPGDSDQPKTTGTLDPDSLLGSMLKQDESIYVCPAGSVQTLPSIECLGKEDLDVFFTSNRQESICQSSLFTQQSITASRGDDNCEILNFMGSLGISPEDLNDELFLSIDHDDGNNNMRDLTDGVLSYIQHSLKIKTSDVQGNLVGNPTQTVTPPWEVPVVTSQPYLSDSLMLEQPMSFIMEHPEAQTHLQHQNNPQIHQQTLPLPYSGTGITQCDCSHITVQKQQVHIMNQETPNLPPLLQLRNAQDRSNIPHVLTNDSQQVPPLYQPGLQESEYFYSETCPLEVENSYRNHLNTVSISCSQELSSPYITAGDTDVSAFITQDLEELLSSLDGGGIDRNRQLGQNVGVGVGLSLDPQSYIDQIIISYERKDRRIICQSDVAGIVENLGKKNFGRAANLISRHRELMEYLKSSVLDIVEDECKKLCNPQHHFMLWRTSSSDLQKFSFTELFEDLKRLSPFIFSMIAKMAKDSLPHICTAASVALRGRNPRLSALAYYVDAVLLYGGAKKAVFQRLGKLGISTIHQSAVGKQKELAHNCKPPVFSLKKDLESYLSSQVTNISEQERTLKVSTSISSCPGEPTKQPTEVVDVRDVFTFSALSDEDMADLGVVPLSVPALPATSIPHTYSIVFDNLDFFIRTHHQSTNQTNKSIHWIHHMCVIDRIPSLHLPNTKPANSLSDYDLGESLPGQHTQACMRREFVVLGSRILTSYLEVLKPFASAVVHHIPHLYTDEMAQTSTHFPLGLLFKNENKTGDLVDVLQHIQKEYVARCPDGLEKILVGGDRLTEGNSRNVQWAFADGETEEDRLEGLVFKFEDWHAIRNLFEIYHQIFFDENSAKDHGTLLSNMNLLR